MVRKFANSLSPSLSNLPSPSLPDKPIFSLDIHPDGSRVATGGQGNDCGRVTIWNMLPIKNEAHELDAAHPKMLSQMDNHLGCVNCVRWSLNGSMLASGGDDKIIMIWKRAKAGGASFGGFSKNHENWRCVHTLRGHEGDVLDLSWSPGDRWLASSSVDNSVFVWDLGTTGGPPTVMSILRGHTGLVKGVTWDPVGKYLASQSDDRSVKIWKTSDWTCDSTITDPFVECGGTTHVLRLSWSPDGQYLVSAHAMNGGGPTAQIIDREGWKCDKDFVGHRKAVTCVRFHGSIMMRTAPKTSKTQQYCVLAVGSRDKSLSVWMTALQRPLVVIHEVFQDSVLDMSWSTDGYILMACSGDGTVIFIQFNEQDLGTPLSEVEKNALYQRMYGKGVHDMNVSTDKDSIIENAEQLNCSFTAPPTMITMIKPPKLIVPSSTAFLSPADLIPKENYSKIASRMEGSSSSSLLISSSGTGTSTNTLTTAINQSPAKQAIHKQIETRTKDGKRRITPMFIPINQEDMETETTSQVTVVATTVTSAPQINPLTAMTTNIQLKPHETSPLMAVRSNGTGMDSRLAKVDKPPAKTDSSLFTAQSSAGQNLMSTPQKATIPAARSLFSSTSGRQEFTSGITRIIDSRRVVVQNNFQKPTPATPTAIHRVVCYNHKTTSTPTATQPALWQFITGSAICNFNSCTRYLVIGCVDGTVHFLDVKYGSLVLPVITMANVVVQSAFSLAEERGDGEEDGVKDLAGIVTETGIVRIWDLTASKTDLAVTCQDLLQTGSSSAGGGGNATTNNQSTGQSNSFTTILMFAITANGTPFVVLGNGTSYCYARTLDSWLVLSGKDLLQQRAMIRCAPSPNTDMKRFPLTSIQTTVLGMMSPAVVRAATAQGGANEWEALAQLGFIDNQLRLCEAVHSPEELKYWYSRLGYTLALGVGTEMRLRQLLDDLLGPVYASAEMQRKRKILVSKGHLFLTVDWRDNRFSLFSGHSES